MEIRKSCNKSKVRKILWHILLTILFKIDARGIEFAANRSRAKMDASVKMIDRNIAAIKDGATAASAIVGSDDVADLEFAVDALTIDVTIVAKNVACLETSSLPFESRGSLHGARVDHSLGT